MCFGEFLGEQSQHGSLNSQVFLTPARFAFGRNKLDYQFRNLAFTPGWSGVSQIIIHGIRQTGAKGFKTALAFAGLNPQAFRQGTAGISLVDSADALGPSPNIGVTLRFEKTPLALAFDTGIN